MEPHTVTQVCYQPWFLKKPELELEHKDAGLGLADVRTALQTTSRKVLWRVLQVQPRRPPVTVQTKTETQILGKLCEHGIGYYLQVVRTGCP